MSKKNSSKWNEVLTDLYRLTKVVLEDLERGSRDKLMDPKEMRLHASIVIRSIRLYLKTLDKDAPKQHWIRRASPASEIPEAQVKTDQE